MSLYEMKKTSFYYVIVNSKSGRMLLQDCKLPIYWSLFSATERCKVFTECKVLKLPAKDFNNLISSSF